ncbi:MAG: carboxypeptidase regulatory-like domain-containing protein [Planctomycetes bacterium]|nr:carboxypeptidase regulatory-like domain-containing protein [Planctomycetota bacterium]
MARDHSPDPLAPATHPYAREREVSGLRLGPGEQMVDVDIRLREAAAIEGLVTDSEGNPALAAEIHCRSTNVLSIYSTTWKVDHKGHFLIGGLKKGEFLVRAIQQRQVSDWVTVSTQLNETSRANLALEAGTMLNVTVNANGLPVSKCYVRIKDSGGRTVASTILHDGSTQLGPLFPGHYTVTASTSGEDKLKGSLPIQVSGEPSASLELTLQ